MVEPDWIVIGGGLTGAALSYELSCRGCSVLLLDSDRYAPSATQVSYGGIAYWSGTTPLTQLLCAEARHRYPVLGDELGCDIQFRELDLLLTIPSGTDWDRHLDLESIAATYRLCADPPQLISVQEAVEREPLLDKRAIAAALTVRHGHVSPSHLVRGYIQAFLQRGGVYRKAHGHQLLWSGDRPIGVETTDGERYGVGHTGGQIIVCAGGWARELLQNWGIQVPVYFTHAEVLETDPVDWTLRSLVMPAVSQRFAMETEASQPDRLSQWEQRDPIELAWILDGGAVQFQDGRLLLGQISRIVTDPHTVTDAQASEQAIRTQVESILPCLQSLPAQWHHCLVAFSGDRLPLVGALQNGLGLQVFTGFSNPLALVPPLARRYAHQLTGSPDPWISSLSPNRFEFIKKPF